MLGVATLAFHDDVARELAAVDALLILGRGLGDRRVVSRLLAHWCETPSALVLVLNPPDNLDWINAGLLDSGVDEAALLGVVEDEAEGAGEGGAGLCWGDGGGKSEGHDGDGTGPKVAFALEGTWHESEGHGWGRGLRACTR